MENIHRGRRERGNNKMRVRKHKQTLITVWLDSYSLGADYEFVDESSDNQDRQNSIRCPECTSRACPYWRTHAHYFAETVVEDADDDPREAGLEKSVKDWLVVRQSGAGRGTDTSGVIENSMTEFLHGTLHVPRREPANLPYDRSSEETGFFDLPLEVRTMIYKSIEQSWDPERSASVPMAHWPNGPSHYLGGRFWLTRLDPPCSTPLLLSRLFTAEYLSNCGSTYPLLVLQELDTSARGGTQRGAPASMIMLQHARHLEFRFSIREMLTRTWLQCRRSAKFESVDGFYVLRTLLNALYVLMPNLQSVVIKIAFNWESNNYPQLTWLWDSLPHDFQGMYNEVVDLIGGSPPQLKRIEFYEWIWRPGKYGLFRPDITDEDIALYSYPSEHSEAVQNYKLPLKNAGPKERHPQFDSPTSTTLLSSWDKREGWHSWKGSESVSIDDLPFYRDFVYGRGTIRGERWPKHHYLHGRGKNLHPADYRGCTSEGLRYLVQKAKLKDPFPQGLTLKWFYWQLLLREGSKEHLA